MKNLFEQSRSHWVRYDRYELKTAADCKRYITPGKQTMTRMLSLWSGT